MTTPVNLNTVGLFGRETFESSVLTSLKNASGLLPKSGAVTVKSLISDCNKGLANYQEGV